MPTLFFPPPLQVTTQLSTKADVSAVYTKSDVDAYFSTTVAVYSTGFQASTPKTGWSYLYNRNGKTGWKVSTGLPLEKPPTNNTFSLPLGPIGNANNYVPLVWNADTGTYATSATAYPNPDPLGAFATLTKTGGHPGRSDTQGVDHDIFVIAGYKVSKAGIYTIHKATLSQSPGGDGVEIRVYVNNQMRNLVDVDAYEEKGIPNIYDGDFDVYLGQLNVNDMIYVCVGPHGADSADGFAFDYTISMGKLAW